MPRAPLAAPWCSLLLCAAPLGAFPLTPACDTSRLEGWSVNADGGDGLVFRIDPAGEPGGRPHLALEFVRGARGWGNLAAAVAVPGDAIGLRLRLRVRAAAPESGFYVWLLERDGDARVARVLPAGRGLDEAGGAWHAVFLPFARFGFEPRGNGTKEFMTVDRLLLGCAHASLAVDVGAVDFVCLNPPAAPAALPPPGAAPRAAVLDAAGLPRRGAPADPRRIEALLTGGGFEVFVLDAAALAWTDLAGVDLLVLPLGPVFPAPAARNVRAFLSRGGSLLAMGGYAFDAPVVPLDDGTFIETAHAVPASEVDGAAGAESINTRFGKRGDTLGLGAEQIGMFDPSDRFEGCARIDGGPIALRGAFAGWSAVGLIGTNDPVAPAVNARWEPLLTARDRYGRDRGPAAGLLRHTAPPFRGGVWAFFGVDNADLFAPGLLPDDYIVRLARACAARAGASELRTHRACYRPGETVSGELELGNFGRRTRRWSIAVRAFGAEVLLRERDLAPGETCREAFTARAPNAHGLYVLRATCTLAPEDACLAAPPLECACCVWDPAAGVEGPALAFGDNRFRVNGKPVFLTGTNQTGVVWHSASEGPLLWQRDFARQRDHALNVIRYLHFGIRADQLAKDPPDEDLCRKTDALVYLLARHDQIPMLTLHDWQPVALDGEALAAQARWARFWSARYRGVKGFLIDIQNEPVVKAENTASHRSLWREFAATLEPAARDPEAVLGGAALSWADPAGELRERFRLWLFRRWTGANAAGAREGNPGALVTVGLLPWNGPIDKALAFEGLDYACFHFYGALPDLAVEAKWADRSLAGQGLTFGEFGAQEAHDARVRGLSGEFAEESIRRYAYTVLTGAGLGATMALSWDLREKAATVFPWGMAHRDGRPKQVLRAFRALSLFLRGFAPGPMAPRAVLVLESAKRLSAGKEAVDAAIGTSMRTLLHCGVPFLLANEEDERAGRLARLGPESVVLRLPAGGDKEALNRAYEKLNARLVARFGPRRPTMRFEVPTGAGTLVVIANPAETPVPMRREEGFAGTLSGLSACAVHRGAGGETLGLAAGGRIELASGAELTLPEPSVLFAPFGGDLAAAEVLVLAPLAEGGFALRSKAAGFDAFAVGEIVAGAFATYEEGALSPGGALAIDADRRGCLILLGRKERFEAAGKRLCALARLRLDG